MNPFVRARLLTGQKRRKKGNSVPRAFQAHGKSQCGRRLLTRKVENEAWEMDYIRTDKEG